jgi:hypothetical protein
MAWWGLAVTILLVMALVSACTEQNPAFLLSDLAETGIAGTQYARALASLVAATQAAREPTPTPAPALTEAVVTPGVAQPTAPESACANGDPGREVYVYASEGFCFLYPSDFIARQPTDGTIDFVGPALGDANDPVRAYVSIQKKEPVNNRTLDEIMLEEWSPARVPFRSYNIQLGGRDALVAEGLTLGESDTLVTQVIFVQNKAVFVMTLSPYENQEPHSWAYPYMQKFWGMAIPSFTFFQ